ncbi:hypothetical protein EW145_g287 [Phellinidium pouzarii]|uniref:P/Homo B domain-containing protein n=1 Tax=Phellinidium pouzarii TaxID=167371 RepID=A0A4V3XE30_9AGAM|nr:hypothetical protein EW145_g287 [Phellinidium pouzarii]
MNKRESEASPSDERLTKKPKFLADACVFDDPSREVQWTDIERTLASDVRVGSLGWIEGDVRMQFANRNKSDAQLSIRNGLQLKISVSCPEFAVFKFAIGQKVKLSLRGGRIVKARNGSSAPDFMPFSLVFGDGAAIQFVKGGNKGTIRDGEIVDTWQMRAQASNDEPEQTPELSQKDKDWYSTPLASRKDQPVDDAPETLAEEEDSTSHQAFAVSSPPSTSSPKTPGKEGLIPVEPSVTISSADKGDDDIEVDIHYHGSSGENVPYKANKSHEAMSGRNYLATLEQKVKNKKRDTRHDHIRNTVSRVLPSASDVVSEPAARVRRTRMEKKMLKKQYKLAAVENVLPPRSPSPPKRDPALDLAAGVSCGGGAYPALADIRATQNTQVIGIVAALEEPSVTRNGDFKLTMTLVDPSKYRYGECFKVTCFMRAGFQVFLPSPASGHVVLLRNVKTSAWHGNINGTVYADKLKWIAYNPSTGKVYFPSETASVVSPFGPAFDPLYKARREEISYFKQLGEWWGAVKEEEEHGAIQIQDYARNKKEHRLFGYCNVNEFFDATAEIVKHYDKSDHDQTTLLLSDYTPHSLLSNSGPYGQWAIIALSSKISEEDLDRMTVGSYWSIRNIRLKIGSQGNIEVDLFAADFTELDAENNAEDIHLQALLKRKEAYLLEHPPETEGRRNGGDGAISLISDISENGHLNVIVELLHRVNARDDVSDLYVTDYTENSLLASYKPDSLKRILKSESLSVFRIGVWGERDILRDLEIGSIYQITDIRIISDQDGGFKGSLKFAEQRISRVNIRKNENMAVVALLKKKGEYSMKRQMSTNPTPSPPAEAPTSENKSITGLAIRSQHTDQPKSTIKEIKEHGECPNKYMLSARIVDFYPLDISDFAVRRCRNCKEMIPENRHACTMCEDMMGEFVEWVYRFFFVLEDEEGEKILVDACSEGKTFLAGLDPCDFHEETDKLTVVQRRLRECLGNLVEVHEGLKKQELVEAQYGPFLDLAVKSWEVDDRKRKRVVYSLTGSLLCRLIIEVEASSTPRQYGTHDYYVLEHDPAAGVPLRDVLTVLDLELVEQAGELRDHWLLRRPKNESSLPSRSADRVDALVHRRVATEQDRWISKSVRHFVPQTLRTRAKRDDYELRAPQPADWLSMKSSDIAQREGIADPEFGDQWHLVNDENPVHMVNVAPVWDMGITGEGIISAIVDDGLDFESDDLAANFDAVNSYDFNLHVDLPKPVLSDDHHGTRCAGQIAAVRNDVCGVGIAYESKVAGVRILSGPISDVDEAAALNYGFQNTSIYSCSWGPADDGRSMEGPSYLIQKAVVNGIQNGRGGKGSVFVFASGNGAARGDQCNFDGYTNSIYSVTVAAVDYKGLHPYYSEACAANMVVTYSSGSGKHIVTTDIGKNKCSQSHGGTSAAAPNAVAIFALALSTRPELTWRDIQHLCVRTAKMINPDDPDWEETAAGRRFSYKYGYGSLDAFAYVQAAQTWEPVKPQAWLHADPIQLKNGTMNIEGEMDGGEPIVAGGVTSTTTISTQMLQDSNFEKLEHITVRVWIKHSRRGDVEVELVSPNGFKSILAGRRKYDSDSDGFRGWTFMTIKHWDENPIGNWSIRVSDQNSEDHSGSFIGWAMTLWGSVIDASEAKTFVLVDSDVPFPPPADLDDTFSSDPTVTSKTYPKPTEHLPGDHGTAEGEADTPAFSSAQNDAAEKTASGPAATSSSTESMVPTADEGWFPGMYNLVANSKWVFGAIGAVVLFGIAGGVLFLWRRRVAGRAQYRSLAGDDVAMDTIARSEGRTVGTKELYDAFGEVSDDEYADEESGLRQPLAKGTMGFHSGFLEDDEPPSGHSHPSLYTDEPTDFETRREGASDSRSGREGSKSPSDGSWEHADPSL